MYDCSYLFYQFAYNYHYSLSRIIFCKNHLINFFNQNILHINYRISLLLHLATFSDRYNWCVFLSFLLLLMLSKLYFLYNLLNKLSSLPKFCNYPKYTTYNYPAYSYTSYSSNYLYNYFFGFFCIFIFWW